MEENLELELCPHCLKALKDDPSNYENVRLQQLLKYGDFTDANLAEAVRLLHEKVKTYE